ncbi:sensor histidine kinase [Hyalangium rubrum]|uniref:histidine kinase n=1 Tax=Hyalangium rubrum TaxID=3103134 RepID=A0ABU5GYT8_9BACT|nr:sensor histidine kinase [Hyalangium sp. s54d21]MDY7226042.1 sensor histidine kinase [Hyalangium sp. s54d21]
MWLSRPGLRRPRPLRWHLALLIAGAVLPVVAFSGLVVLQRAHQMQEVVERRLQRSAHMITFSFEREASASIRTLQALAQSATLDHGDIEGFRAEALRVAQTQPSWLTVVLLTPEGEQLVNLRRPKGAPTVRVTEPASLRRTLETRQPTIGDLAPGQSTGQWAFPLRVPVIRDDQPRYVLTAVITPQALAGAVTHQRPVEDDEFTRTIVDRQGLIVFRTKNPERFIGTPATPNFLKSTRASTEGVFRSVTLEGSPSYVAFSRSSFSGWTSAVVVPVEVVNGSFRRSLLAVAVLGVLALLLSVVGAIAFSRRFARGIHSAAAAAEALATGGQPRIEPSPIAEVERLGHSLGVSAERLRQHAQVEQRARQELEQAVQARDEFLSLASHELKTPLTSLMLQAQLLQRRLQRDQSLPPETMGKLLDQTSRQAQRLARLVNDMLDISRITAGKLDLETETFDLAMLASEVVAKLSPQLAEARCEVSVQAPEPVIGSWDRHRLEQVLTNLLTNAARYGAGAPVEVSVRRRGHQVELRVRDRGRGIAPADQERIFQKFERAVNGSEVSGLGLGLFIVRELVEMHGGTVHVESTLGQGATFTVVLSSLEPPVPAGVSAESTG